MPMELVLRIGPGESAVRFDRPPVVGESREIERLRYAGGLAAQQDALQAERLGISAASSFRRSRCPPGATLVL